MIKYRLRCARGHEFETWFQNISAYDTLAKRGQLTCATCGSPKVEKAMMAPRIGKAGAVATVESAAPPQVAEAATTIQPSDNPELQGMRAALKALRAEVIANADYVGPRFAEEARRMHDDEAPVRGIYGEASMDDVRELLEDGISILPLPPAPDDHN
jgi:hypothetical protein